jgi:predicted deacylase
LASGKIVTIGSVSVEPGSKASGRLEISRTLGGSVFVPFTIVNGAEAGPTLLADGCVHGNELVGAISIPRLAQSLDPKKLRGTFIGVPVVNLPAFEGLSYTTPDDSLNLCASFPGKADGTITERIAYTYFNEIISRANYYISMHGAPVTFVNTTAVLVADPAQLSSESKKMSKKVADKSMDLAKVFGLSEIWLPAWYEDGNPVIQAARIGIPGIQPELGNGGDWSARGEEYIEGNIRGITNVMKHLGMTDGKPEGVPKKWEVYAVYSSAKDLAAKHGGIWTPKRKLGSQVKKGDILGTITSPFTGELLQELKAPIDGRILTIDYWPATKPREASSNLIALGRPVKN